MPTLHNIVKYCQTWLTCLVSTHFWQGLRDSLPCLTPAPAEISFIRPPASSADYKQTEQNKHIISPHIVTLSPQPLTGSHTHAKLLSRTLLWFFWSLTFGIVDGDTYMLGAGGTRMNDCKSCNGICGARCWWEMWEQRSVPGWRHPPASSGQRWSAHFISDVITV